MCKWSKATSRFFIGKAIGKPKPFSMYSPPLGGVGGANSQLATRAKIKIKRRAKSTASKTDFCTSALV